MTNTKKHNQEGFTLIELSIVLVIIGLIVGGILAGQDMIKAAEVRATISQLEKYNTAVNTYRDKYRYIPGDVPASQATKFGFTARSGATGHGDGNRLLESCAANAITFGCENVLFWMDLNTANLMDYTMDSGTDALTACTDPDNCKRFMPEAKLGRGNLITVFSFVGANYFEIHGVEVVSATGVYTLRESMSPQEGYNIDSKLDDGSPLTGAVRATEGTGPVNAVAPGGVTAAATGLCVHQDGNADENYNTTTEDFANAPACGLRFKMQ